MKKTIARFIAVLICTLFWVTQLKFFNFHLREIPELDNVLFVEFFVIGAILFAAALFIFLKYLPDKLAKIELISMLFSLLALLFTTLIANGIEYICGLSIVIMTRNIRYILYLLGIIGFCLTKHKINFSFILMGLYIWLWQVNLYNTHF